jgi:hypothetical protein
MRQSPSTLDHQLLTPSAREISEPPPLSSTGSAIQKVEAPPVVQALSNALHAGQ